MSAIFHPLISLTYKMDDVQDVLSLCFVNSFDFHGPQDNNSEETTQISLQVRGKHKYGKSYRSGALPSTISWSIWGD